MLKIIKQMLCGLTDRYSSKRGVAFILVLLTAIISLSMVAMTMAATMKAYTLSNNLIELFKIVQEMNRDVLLATLGTIGVIVLPTLVNGIKSVVRTGKNDTENDGKDKEQPN